MNNKLIAIICMLLLSVSMVFSQSVMLKPFGVSPRDAASDTLDIFDRAYNGLLNVGVETKMFLTGSAKDTTLTDPEWTITQQPEGSVAAVSGPVNMDDSQVVSFTPDVVGTYIVQFTDGDLSAAVTINAGTYLGAGAGDGNCVLCHSDKAAEWEETGHYSLFERAMEGDPEVAGHYASYCIGCHTTGYDVNAANGGFDDREFVFPDSLFPGQWANLLAAYPDAMKLARIQCESCHGPGSAHMGVTEDSKMVSTLATENCAWCHDSGTHHVFPDQWEVSGHANPPVYRTGTWRSSCARCHTGTAFIQYVEGETVEGGPTTPFTCAVCHDPHSVKNKHQLRTVEATKLGNGVIITQGGTGKLCMNCHMARRNAATYTEYDNVSSHYGPHYGVQADMLAGTNAVTFGVKLPSSPHLAGTENACVDCHMAGDHLVDDDGNVIHYGGHSFVMEDPDGHENVHACEPCHGDIGESFHEKKFFVNGNADHDGDGVEEGLQEEVHGLMDQLAGLLPAAEGHDAYDAHDTTDSTFTRTELKAAYNFEMVYYDHSYGIHNPAFTVALLKVSIQALKNNAIEGEIVAIEDVPNDQGKQVRIIWDKFVDDGVVAIDPVVKYIVKRHDNDDVWTGVGEHTADHSNRYALVVPTVFDSTAEGDGKTEFGVVAVTRGGRVHKSLPAKGYSVDNLIPKAPSGFVALLSNGDVELNWEAPEDPDINFYRVYRATQEGFVADETTEIGTTADLTFMDVAVGSGTFYYKIAAVDFSGNLGVMSDEVNATVTSVTADKQVPTKFALSQNYPNPFNPVTHIDFSLLKAGHVSLTVYNTLGQKVSTLVDKHLAIGDFAISFSAVGLSSGEYFYRIEVSNENGVQYQSMRKMILMK